MVAILAIGCHEKFFRRWRRGLAAAGLKITHTAEKRQAVRFLAHDRFDLLLVGPSIPVPDRSQLARKARMGGARIIYFYQGSISQAESADAVLSAEVSGEDLLAAIFRLVINGERLLARNAG